MAKEIYKWSLAYAIGRWHVRWGFRFFYRKIVVKGVEHIPTDRPVILAPNHQNALMDALAAIHPLHGVQVFMARADIFQDKTIARILHFFKIMPVFRMRDGYVNLDKNEEIFNKAVEVLEKSRFLCIMPEGTHGEYRQLKPLVKGMFRLAFKYMDENPDKASPVIIPTGLDYSNYSSFRSILIINYGHAIDSKEFYELYKKNSAEGINAFRQKLSEELKKCMIHIESKEHYDTVNFLRVISRPFIRKKLSLKTSTYNDFYCDQYFVNQCNQADAKTLEEIKPQADKLKTYFFKKKIEPAHFNRYTVFQAALQGLLLLIFSPIFLAGYIFHILPVRFPRLMTSKIEDAQFHSSVKYVFVAFLFPIWYLLFGIIFYLLTQSILITLAVLVILAVAGELAYRYSLYFCQFRSMLGILSDKKAFLEAKETLSNISNTLNL